MAVYKEEKTNTWRVIYRYTDWTGERKQSQKRGFKTKREALAWEREQLNKSTADLDITFASFVEQYTADMKTRIKYMYENGNASLLEMLFSAKNMTDFLNKADFIENLSDYDRQALTQLQDIHQEIADQKEDLENQQASMQSLSEQLKSKQTELQAKAVATSTDLDTVNAKLKKAKEEEAARLAEEARQRAAAEAAAKKDNAGQVNGTGGGTITTGGTTVSADDLTLLAAIIQCEAHYNYESMLAVATVIMNRVESSRFPNSISGVVYANGQFAPVWTGSLKRVLSQGPGTLSRQVAQDAINGSRLAAVSDCYFFLYAPSTSRSGVVIGDNVFFTSW